MYLFDFDPVNGVNKSTFMQLGSSFCFIPGEKQTEAKAKFKSDRYLSISRAKLIQDRMKRTLRQNKFNKAVSECNA